MSSTRETRGSAARGSAARGSEMRRKGLAPVKAAWLSLAVGVLVLGMKYAGHVYGEAARVTPALIRHKPQTARAPGARFAATAFVPGTLDPARSREEFQALFQPLPLPVMAVIGEASPRRSRGEMDALASLPGMERRCSPACRGSMKNTPSR